jgi:chaperonin GroEL
MLEDIAIVTGGTAIFEELGIKLENVEVSPARPRQEGPHRQGQLHDHRRRRRREGHQGAASSSSRTRSTTRPATTTARKLQERLAKLAGGVAQINVGAATEVAMKEKKARVEDALHACRAGGRRRRPPRWRRRRHPRAAKVLDKVKKNMPSDDQQVGVEIIRRAIEAPIKQIVENAGGDGGVVAQKVKESKDTNFGYNALTHEYGDMLKMGVIVPTKVERTALQNAASISGLLLTTDAIISELKEDKPEPAGAPGGGMYYHRRRYTSGSRRDRETQSVRRA